MVDPALAWHAEYGAGHSLVLHVEGSVVIDEPLFYFGTFVPGPGVKYWATAERVEGEEHEGGAADGCGTSVSVSVTSDLLSSSFSSSVQTDPLYLVL